MGQPTGRTAWRWRGDIALAGTRFSPTVELGRRVIFVADRRAFPGREFFRINRSNLPGFFSRRAERSCGGVCPPRRSDPKTNPPQRSTGVSFPGDESGAGGLERFNRSGPRIQSQHAERAVRRRGFFGPTRGARPSDITAPPRRGFSFPGKRTSPGVFFSLMGFPGWTPWGFSRLTNLVRRTNGGHNAMRMNSRMNHGMNTAPAGGPGIGVTD